MLRFQRNDLQQLVTEVVSSLNENKQSHWLLESPEQLAEGVYDPGILKAVFTAGGPGSGKSYVADVIFGVREPGGEKTFQKASMVADTGLKYVNSDHLFELGLKKAGIDPADLASIEDSDPVLWNMIQDPDDPASIRNIAKEKLQKLRSFYESGRLGLLIDGTGKDKEKLQADVERMESLGYDTSMIYVDTDLETALARNRKRDRSLSDGLVERLWRQVRDNKDYYSTMFGDNFALVDNSEDGPPPREIVSAMRKFASAPNKNPIGQQWQAGQLSGKSKK